MFWARMDPAHQRLRTDVVRRRSPGTWQRLRLCSLWRPGSSGNGALANIAFGHGSQDDGHV